MATVQFTGYSWTGLQVRSGRHEVPGADWCWHQRLEHGHDAGVRRFSVCGNSRGGSRGRNSRSPAQ
ncbi:unnamed protein product, partial [Amoebophrya sp. A120]|eukprot:GSA120T00011123001.1